MANRNDSQGPVPLEKAMERLLKNAQLASERKNEAEAKKKELYINTVSDQAPLPPGEAVDSIADQIDHVSETGKIGVTPIRPGNEYPILFTRLPIFIPSRRIKQKNDLMDVNTAVKFSCVFGRGARMGPPLTTFDEDVFMALLRLRQNRIKGLPEDLPMDTETGKKPVNVDHLVCQLTDIFRVLGLEKGGSLYERVKTSVKNLDATTIHLEDRLVDRYFGELHKGKSIRLFRAEWCLADEEGVFQIQFDSVVTRWLAREFAYVDWNIRKQLKSPLSKALHRFLSSQGNHHRQGLKKIADSVGYAGPSRNISARFKTALDELVRVGFLNAYTISGTGRSTPLMLDIYR